MLKYGVTVITKIRVLSLNKVTIYLGHLTNFDINSLQLRWYILVVQKCITIVCSLQSIKNATLRLPFLPTIKLSFALEVFVLLFLCSKPSNQAKGRVGKRVTIL